MWSYKIKILGAFFSKILGWFAISNEMQDFQVCESMYLKY